MKKIIATLFLTMTSLAFSAINPVTSGSNIQASKINEIITLVNELKAENIVLKQAVVPVGTVYSSILTLTQYREQNGDCWRALDGLALSSSDELRSLYGYTIIPNGSSRFLRNAGSSSVALGLTQEDAFQGHGHKIPFSDPGGANNNRSNSLTATSQKGANTGNEYTTEWQMINGQSSIFPDSMNNGFPRTAPETRPMNLTVNMFIKFKKTCNF